MLHLCCNIAVNNPVCPNTVCSNPVCPSLLQTLLLQKCAKQFFRRDGSQQFRISWLKECYLNYLSQKLYKVGYDKLDISYKMLHTEYEKDPYPKVAASSMCYQHDDRNIQLFSCRTV